MLDRAERDKPQSDPFDERREVGTRDHGDVVAARLERQPDADVRVHIARATDGDENDLHDPQPSDPGYK